MPRKILDHLKGKTFVGGGTNMLFRPNDIVTGANTVTFPNPISPLPPKLPNNNVLEINFFQETLTFSTAIAHSIPNQSFKCQGDICLNAIMYLQTINDVTNCQTGLPDGSPSHIHAENGMFIYVPATDKDPVIGATIGRLGSIPHGVICDETKTCRWARASRRILSVAPRFRIIEHATTIVAGSWSFPGFACATI